LVEGVEEGAIVTGPREPIVAVRGAEAIEVKGEPQGVDEEVVLVDVD
jgi:hypothetical protein